jgi:predicted  nucleic acid-binding Zn-ribbon protein
MKKKLGISMALMMTVALSMPVYVLADASGDISTTNTTTTTTTSSNAASASVSAATTTTSSSLSLSLDDAVSRVETGYNQIVLDDQYIQILDRQYQEALATQQSLQQTQGSSIVETDMENLKYNAPNALYNLNNQKHQRDIDLKNAKVTVTNEYESILAAQMQVEYIKQEIASLQKDMDSINAKIQVGVDKPSDIEPDKATMATYQASLSSAQNGIQSSMISLKNDLGIDLNTQLILTSKPMTYTKYDDTNLDGKIQTAIQDSYTMKSLQQQIDNTKILYSIYQEYSDGNADSTQINIEALQNQLNQTPNNITVQLKTQYNSLKSLQNTIEADNLGIEAAQINFNTTQQNYNQGQATSLDVIKAQLQVSNAKNTLQQDVISYMTASMNFQNALEEQ